jgi:hypothetical protein
MVHVRRARVGYLVSGVCDKSRGPAALTAGVAELADALDLGSSDENRGGSNPPARTNARFRPRLAAGPAQASVRRRSGEAPGRAGPGLTRLLQLL